MAENSAIYIYQQNAKNVLVLRFAEIYAHFGSCFDSQTDHLVRVIFKETIL